ncbi:uncharacterized protein PADG_08190 [Paracoccidioides brasiliensis Pb18]|uniref:Fe2OG dioxygenase domain-containing protein n=1 Tax=Paracoccidioides brasiliensis (strain Pb18) TaxID=502780 RepID=C1GMA4_PARBD|nr:uncharacterized protein PADG_08190 [Paracoccidioides brasiliensis Pb18]EEH43570.1 hypothetical protein PADG_08190 [Paracoccidioides brasiliensis Pb18]
MAPKANKKSSAKQTPSKTTSTSIPSTSTNTTPPNWPPLKPLIPPSDLHLTTLLKDQILIIRNLFTGTLCKTYVSFLSSLPLVTTPTRPKRGEAVRFNDRFHVHDPAFAERLWSSTALRELVLSDESGGGGQGLWGGEVLGLNPNIRIYRYGPGQFFDRHYDDSVPLSIPSPSPTNNNTTTTTTTIRAKTTWTLLIYLTTCTGGETAFYPEKPTKASRQPDPVVVGLEAGMALLHRHGESCLLHEGREVTEGEKWVIRSDLVVRR